MIRIGNYRETCIPMNNRSVESKSWIRYKHMTYDQKSSPEYYSDLIVRVFDRQFIYDDAIEVKSNLRWIARTRRDIKFNGRDQLAIFSYLKHSELPNSEQARLLGNSE